MNTFKIVILILFLTSCSRDCKKITLLSNEIIWYNNYKHNDTLLFKSQDGNKIDSFVISVKQHYFTPCNRFELGDYQYDQAWISAELLNSCATKVDKYAFTFNFDKYQQTDSKDTLCNKYFTVFNLVSDNINDLEHIQKDTLFVDLYQQALEVTNFTHSKEIRDRYSDKKLEYFTWNKNFGLISYTLETGETYIRYK